MVDLEFKVWGLVFMVCYFDKNILWFVTLMEVLFIFMVTSLPQINFFYGL